MRIFELCGECPGFVVIAWELDGDGEPPQLPDLGASDPTLEVVFQRSELRVEGPEGQDGGDESGLEQVLRVHATVPGSTGEAPGLRGG